MLIRVSTVVLCALLMVAVAQGSSARPLGRPDACKLLAAALRKESAVFRAHMRLQPGGNWAACNYSDGKPLGPGAHWSLSFSFIPAPSAAKATHFWQQVWQQWRHTTGKGLTVARLRGFGADNAFGWEKVDEDPSETTTEIHWQRGIYYGQLWLEGPGSIGDLESAEMFFKTLMPGIPRS